MTDTHLGDPRWFPPLHNQFLPLECETCDLLLTSRIWQRPWDGTSMIRSHHMAKVVDSLLWLHSNINWHHIASTHKGDSPGWPWGSKLLWSKLPMNKATWQETWWPLGDEGLCSKTHEPGRKPWASDETAASTNTLTAACETLSREPAKLSPTLHPSKLW